MVLTLFIHRFSSIDFHQPIPVTNIQQSWRQKLKLRGLIYIQRQNGKILCGELRWVFLWVLLTFNHFFSKKVFFYSDILESCCKKKIPDVSSLIFFLFCFLCQSKHLGDIENGSVLWTLVSKVACLYFLSWKLLADADLLTECRCFTRQSKMWARE